MPMAAPWPAGHPDPIPIPMELRPEGRSMPMLWIGTPIIVAAGAHAITLGTPAVPGQQETTAPRHRPGAAAPITGLVPEQGNPRPPTVVPVAGALGPISPRVERPLGAAAIAGLPAVVGARAPFKVQGAVPEVQGPVGLPDLPVQAEVEIKIVQTSYKLNF